MDKINKGSIGEEIAKKFLISKGYKIIQTNFTTAIGELDIIAQDGDTIVFIEVKARKSNKYGFPSESVTYLKQRKIAQVASQYIRQFSLYDSACRFDVIEVYLSENKVEHIENAFDSYLSF